MSESMPCGPQVSAGLAAQYREPFGWWGYHRTPPEPRSIVWLMQQGAIDARLSAFLSLAVELRRSLIVIAEPHEAGKTTLLTALLDFLPDDVQPVYLRGWYERFAFLRVVPPERAYVLCNEISAHLPTYLWGHGVRRIFESAELGYPLATTMHASSAADAFAQLAAFPLEAPVTQLAAIDLVVSIGVGYVNNRLQRRVTRVERVRPAAPDIGFEILAEREPLRAELQSRLGRLVASVAEWSGAPDAEASTLLARRTRQLEAWAEREVVTPAALRAALRVHRAEPAPAR